jgi:endonuclease YncB( thermonuclease family)
MLLLILVLLVSFHNPPLVTITGKVVKVVDGDTFDVLDSSFKTIRIRMNGIDAPEKKQAFGEASRKQLASLCAGKLVRIVKYSTDRNKRWIADSYVDGISLSHRIIEEGMAWHFVKYSSDTTLARLEQQARAKKIGLWSDPHAIAPWDYRSKRLRN